MLIASMTKHRVSPFATANTWTSVLGGLLADHTGIAFLSPNHTSDMVEVTALGPGAERLPPMIENTELHGLAVTALGLAPAAQLPGTGVLLKPADHVKDD